MKVLLYDIEAQRDILKIAAEKMADICRNLLKCTFRKKKDFDLDTI